MFGDTKVYLPFFLQKLAPKVSEATLVASSIPNFDVRSIPQESGVAKLTKNCPVPKTLLTQLHRIQKKLHFTFLGTKPSFHAFYAVNFNHLD